MCVIWICECISTCPCVWELVDNFWGGSALSPMSWTLNEAVRLGLQAPFPLEPSCWPFQFTFCSHHCISPAAFARIHEQQHQAACVLQAVWESWFLELRHSLVLHCSCWGLYHQKVLFSEDSFRLEPCVTCWFSVVLGGLVYFTEKLAEVVLLKALLLAGHPSAVLKYQRTLGCALHVLATCLGW